MELKEMMATEEEKVLVPLKEQRGETIFLYVVEDTRINAMIFFDASGMNAHVKLIIRPNGGKKLVIELSDADAGENQNVCGYFVHMLQDANIHTFTDSFYQKFSVLVARWLKLIGLLNTLARVSTKDAAYLTALCDVLGITGSMDKEKDCTQTLMECLESYEEFRVYAAMK